MIRLSSQFLQDPIILVAVIVAIAAIAVFTWAVMSWQKLGAINSDGDEPSGYDEDETPSSTRAMESAGIFEAQLQEITSQLSDIGTRISAMEKLAQAKAADADKTVNYATSPEIERTLKALESKLDSLSRQGANTLEVSNAVSRLEGKLEGIHRLLILLTDSDNDTAK